MYIENPKTKGSGIITAIPQTGECPNKCEDCFFQSGRSYLEPLEKNLPNVPDVIKPWQVVRVNDGNDSNVQRNIVIKYTQSWPFKFYNTAIPKNIKSFPGPIVLTINPGDVTNIGYHYILKTKNLMFVRFRANTWNLDILRNAIEDYTRQEIPIILTFMAYYKQESIPTENQKDYIFRKRTLNSYYAITTEAWEKIMLLYKYNKWVYSCGKIEGEKGTTACRHCGNCLREYHATMERMNDLKGK